MRAKTTILSIIVLLTSASTTVAADSAPGTLVLNPERLLLAKQRIQAGDPTLMPDYEYLLYAADTVIDRGPWSVMDKEFIPPSGDKHDFMTLGAYYWPNDWSTDGIPWVFRDGYVNPDNGVDLDAFLDMAITTYRLALAYYYTDHEPYAERAAFLIRYWFLDEATYMTPRFEYGSIIPGVDEDGAAALVTTALLMSYICDSMGLIEGSPAWTEADHTGMLGWAEAYLVWLQTSPKVQVERENDTNHGDHHDIHPALMYLFTEDIESARAFLETIGPNRIAVQIEPDGIMQGEINRADSLLYHMVVVRALAFLAEMGANNGVEIWNYTTEDGRSLRKSMDLLVPYVLGEEAWPYFPGDPFPVHWNLARNIYRRGALGYWDPTYADVEANVPGENGWRIQKSGYPFPAPEPADRDDSWVVDFVDVVALIAAWGPCEGADCDLDGDMNIGISDLVILLSRWGRIPG